MAIFGSSTTATGGPEWTDAEMAGSRFARAGLSVVTGGYGGTMEAASKGANEAGGHVIGVVAPSLFPNRARSNPYVTELVEANSLPDRIGTLIALADAALVLPGAIGTAAELVLTWNHNQLAMAGGQPTIPTAAVGGTWTELHTTLQPTTSATDDLVFLAANCRDAVDWLLPRLEKD